MTCKNCQLVELARVKREGRMDVYVCPKCGRMERVEINDKKSGAAAG